MAQTMLGMPATTVGSAGAPAPQPKSAPASPVAPPQQAPAPASPVAQQPPPSGGGFAPVHGQGIDSHAATQAMPQVDPAQMHAQQAQPTQPQQPEQPAPRPQAPQDSAKAAQKVAAKSNRTMLGMMAAPTGMAPPSGPAQAPDTGPQGSAAKKVAAQSNRTMLGMMAAPGAAGPAQPQAPAPQPPQQQGFGGAPAAQPHQDWPEEDPPTLKTPRYGLWIGIVLAVLLVVGAVVGGVMFLGDSGPEVRASVARGEAGETLQVDVPGAPAGTKVRFNGQELPTTAGRVAFPLGANDLQLGDNELTVEVVSPEGDVSTIPLVLTVRYRVRPDLDGLDDAEPKLRIVVDALPGSVVTIDESPVTLDVTGHGVLEVPLEGMASQAVLERTFDYRVVPPGAPPAQGEVRVRVPFATLQVERPSEESITDQAQLEIAGAAHSDATVTVDGNPVEVNEGRFLAEIEVPMGVSEHVVIATRDERAPRRIDLTVRRVADLAAEASSYEVDRNLDYARLAAAPGDYRGRKVAFVGRVYNADVHEGRASLQMVVRDCARGQRCPLWVNHDGGTQVRINQWVRVLGEVTGEQQYRATSGEVRSDPAIEAAFLLPAEGGR